MTDANCSDTLVEINGLWKVFTDRPVDFDLQYEDAMENLEDNGAVVAVRDVSFQVKRGEVFVIMGLSGSGKSTLIRCISRLVEPTQGEIIVKGQNVLEMDNNNFSSFAAMKPLWCFSITVSFLIAM